MSHVIKDLGKHMRCKHEPTWQTQHHRPSSPPLATGASFHPPFPRPSSSLLRPCRRATSQSPCAGQSPSRRRSTRLTPRSPPGPCLRGWPCCCPWPPWGRSRWLWGWPPPCQAGRGRWSPPWNIWKVIVKITFFLGAGLNNTFLMWKNHS